MALPASSRRASDPDEWVAKATAASEDLKGRLESEASRRELLNRVAAEASRLHAEHLIAVSPTAERLVANGGGPVSPGAQAVLVEAHLATGTQLVRAAGRARAQGIAVVGAIAVTADPDGAEFVRHELQAPVSVLEPDGL